MGVFACLSVCLFESVRFVSGCMSVCVCLSVCLFESVRFVSGCMSVLCVCLFV